MDEVGNITYIVPRSRLVREEFQLAECQADSHGKVYKVFDQFNNTRHVTQERITRIFKFAQSDDKFVEELVLGKDTLSDKSLLDYSSFDESGIYSPEFILARRKAMFSGFKYASVQSGLERAITHENDWKEVADGKFDLGAFVSFDKIGEYLLGGFLWQCIHTFLTFLSYLGGLGMLHVLIKKLLSNLNFTLPVKIKLKPQREGFIRREECTSIGLILEMMLKQMAAQTLREGFIRREEVTFKMMLNQIAALTLMTMMWRKLIMIMIVILKLLLPITQTLLLQTCKYPDNPM